MKRRIWRHPSRTYPNKLKSTGKVFGQSYQEIDAAVTEALSLFLLHDEQGKEVYIEARRGPLSSGSSIHRAVLVGEKGELEGGLEVYVRVRPPHGQPPEPRTSVRISGTLPPYLGAVVYYEVMDLIQDVLYEDKHGTAEKLALRAPPRIRTSTERELTQQQPSPRVDAIDQKIIDLLNDDPNITTEAIASQINLSVPQTKKRRAKLANGGKIPRGKRGRK
jgi:hypothetical protein